MPRGERLGPALLFLLFAAALATAIWVTRSRSPDLALELVRMSRPQAADGRGDPARVRFFVRFDEPKATIQIVGRNMVPARTLASGMELRAEELVECVWDGRDDEGEPVEPGRYRLRVLLPSRGRDMVFPRRMRVGEVEGVPPAGGCERLGMRE